MEHPDFQSMITEHKQVVQHPNLSVVPHRRIINGPHNTWLIVQLEQRCVELILEYRVCSLREFLKALNHPSLVTFSVPHKRVIWLLVVSASKFQKNFYLGVDGTKLTIGVDVV